MADPSAPLSVTGHGGQFGVSAPATLTISGSQVLLTGRAGETESLDLYKAEASVLGTCLSIEDPQSLIAFSTRDPRVLSQIRTSCPPELEDGIEEVLAALQKSVWTFWKLLKVSILVIGFLVALGIGLYQALGSLTEFAIGELPVEIDDAIGQTAHQSLLSTETIVDDEEVNQSIQRILDSLRPHISISSMEPKLVVVESEEVNAYCLPGGYITINTGLLKAASSPDEVAGVMAHEIAHATLRHGLKQLAQNVTTTSAVQILLGDVSGILAIGVEGAEFLVNQGYSRDHEREADLEGLRMMAAAGWNPESLASFFEKLDQKNDGISPPAWFSTHPDPGQRASAIRGWAVENGSASELPPEIDWLAVQSALSK